MNKQDYSRTTNRSYYNKLRKRILENTGEIHCAWCGYHKSENYCGNWYGGYAERGGIKYPSWKLVSKNKKQWMQKKLYSKTKNTHFAKNIYTEITWKNG